MDKKTIETLKRIIASPNQSANAKAVAKKKLAELEGKEKPTKKTIKKAEPKKTKKKNELSGWRKEAKDLGIKYMMRKKVDVLADIEKTKGGSKETPTKTSSKLDEKAAENTLKGKMKLKKVSDTEWRIDLDKKYQSFNGGKIKKIADLYNVEVSHKTIGFKSFEEAVKHLEAELYQGVLGQMIDEKVEKAKRARELKANPINTTKSLKNEKEAMANKIKEKGITKAEATKDIDELVGITKVIKNGLESTADKKAFIKSLIVSLQKMLNEL